MTGVDEHGLGRVPLGQPRTVGLGAQVDVDALVGAERAGDDRALRVDLRLLGSQPAGAYQVGDERYGRYLTEEAAASEPDIELESR